jgi:hypothetical protein
MAAQCIERLNAGSGIGRRRAAAAGPDELGFEG